MNRYVVDGLLADMRAGRRVLVLSENQAAARAAFQQVADRLEGGEKATRSNGREQCSGAGFLRFLSIQGRASRGLSADTVFVDADPTPDQLGEVLPAIAASPSAELLRR